MGLHPDNSSNARRARRILCDHMEDDIDLVKVARARLADFKVALEDVSTDACSGDLQRAARDAMSALVDFEHDEFKPLETISRNNHTDSLPMAISRSAAE